MFLILPDEFIENVAITKNRPKGPRAAREPNPSPGVAHFNFLRQSLETSTWDGPAWPWNRLYIEYNFDLKIQRDEQNLQTQKARNNAKLDDGMARERRGAGSSLVSMETQD